MFVVVCLFLLGFLLLLFIILFSLSFPTLMQFHLINCALYGPFIKIRFGGSIVASLNGTCQLPFASGWLFICSFKPNRTLHGKNIIGRRVVVACDLGLHCLPMSNKKDLIRLLCSLWIK